MSEENVEVVRKSFEVFNRDGLEALFSEGIFSSELLVDGSGSDSGVGVYRGHDEVMTFFEGDWFAAFPFADWEIVVDSWSTMGIGSSAGPASAAGAPAAGPR